MSGGLSTHVLDTAHGRPAANIVVQLLKVEGQSRQLLTQQITNQDGRTDSPLIEKGQLQQGTYELRFEVAAYFAQFETAFEATPKKPFLDEITLRFTVSDTSAHYHIPLLVSPWSYSTYRGS